MWVVAWERPGGSDGTSSTRSRQQASERVRVQRQGGGRLHALCGQRATAAHMQSSGKLLLLLAMAG